MNREIKFRYHYLTEGAGADAAFGREIDGILFENGAVSEVLIDGDPWPVAKDEHGECGALCQYTGLKDRNGREIYEGDILEHMNCSGHGVVKWGLSNGEWYAEETDKDQGPIWYGIANEDTLVIGNIYENLGLLK